MRSICNHCERPVTACLCEAFPAQPLACRGLIVVLQHPYEAKRKFATVPLLLRALAGNVLVLRGRTLKGHSAAILRDLLTTASDHSVPCLLLFPGPGVADLETVSQTLSASIRGRAPFRCPGVVDPAAMHQPEVLQAIIVAVSLASYILICVDGTWQQAMEMFKAAQAKVLQEFDFIQRVQLQCSSSEAEQPDYQNVLQRCVLREPAPQCLTTLEALARALSQLEGDEEMYSLLLRPLEMLISQQAKHCQVQQDSKLTNTQQTRTPPRKLRFLTDTSAI